MTGAPGSPPLLRLAGITKRFPGVVALDASTSRCTPGVVHALTGENGSGKSTLARIASGALAPDAGRDRGRRRAGRRSARRRRRSSSASSTISQELTLAPTLSVAENIFMGRLPRGRLRRIDWPRVRADARAVARRPRRPRRRAPRRRRAERRAPAGGRDRARRLLAGAAADPRRGDELALGGGDASGCSRSSSACGRAASRCCDLAPPARALPRREHGDRAARRAPASPTCRCRRRRSASWCA